MHSLNKKFELYITIVLIFAAIIIIAFYSKLHTTWGGDWPFPVYSIKLLYDSFFSWSNLYYSGFPSVSGSIIGIIYYLPFLFINNIAGVVYAQLASVVIINLVGMIGIFLFIVELFNSKNKIVYFGASTAALTMPVAYSFSSINLPAMFLPFLFLTVMLFLRELERNKVNLWYFFLSVIVLSALIAFNGNSFILEVLILLLFGFVFLVLSEKYGLRKRFAIFLSLIGVLAVLINMSWIVTDYLVISPSFVNSVGGSFARYLINFFSLNIFQGLLNFGIDNGLFSNALLALTTLAMVLVGMFSFLYILEKKLSIEGKMVLLIFACSLIFIALSTGVSKPFGPLFDQLISVLPVLLALRGANITTHFIYVFTIPVLFGIGTVEIFKRLHSKNFRVLWIVIILIILGLYIFEYEYLPDLSSHPSIIPNHVYKISAMINNDKSNFAIATLPMAGTWMSTTWYLATNIYATLVLHPAYTGGYTGYPTGTFEAPGSAGYYNTYIGSLLDTSNALNVNISNGLGVLGIKYIIVQGDAICNASLCYTQPFSFTTIYRNLNFSPHISFMRKYGNSSVYMNTNYLPLVYAANLYNAKNPTINSVFATIEGENFSIHRYVVYSTGIYNATEKLNASGISSYAAPKIKFNENSPTSIKVNVKNATTPFYLVFRETYDPAWSAYFSNGTAVSSDDHIMVNGFANAWYINKTGNYTITLYYTPQTVAWIAWGLSSAAFFVTILIGVYGWKEMRKDKHK